MDSDIAIRQAHKSELPSIFQLYAQSGVDSDEHLGVEAAEEAFDRIEQYPNYHLYVALSPNEIVGTFALLIMDNIGHMGQPSGVVENVAVVPALQGTGIGKAMMRYALEICARAECYKLTLSSNLKREGAHAFYESLGFEKHGFSFCVHLPQAQ